VNQCWAWLSIGKAFSTSCWAASFRTCHARSQATAALDLCDADFSTHTSHFTQPLTSHLTRLSLSRWHHPSAQAKNVVRGPEPKTQWTLLVSLGWSKWLPVDVT
jgi:hypothetical protein